MALCRALYMIWLAQVILSLITMNIINNESGHELLYVELDMLLG
jgi:hypothetical protein